MGRVIEFEVQESFKDKVKSYAHKTWDWAKENPEISLTIALTVIGGTFKLAKGVQRAHNIKLQENVKNLYCYDRSLGHYWKLKRELTNVEWREIDLRKRNGERLGDILDDMGVI